MEEARTPLMVRIQEDYQEETVIVVWAYNEKGRYQDA